jgi:tRNA 2-thiouridine synthesizing protein A
MSMTLARAGARSEDDTEVTNAMADKVLDAKGLSCPLPVLKAKKTLESMAKDQILEVQTTDPASVSDFEAFCSAKRHTLVSHSNANGVFTFQIRNAG